MKLRGLLFASLLSLAAVAHAGAGCRVESVGAQELAHATALALDMRERLEARNEPVALVARVGTDLSRFGLKFSHVAFVLRDHPDGRWTVVHLLNRCGTDRSAIYAEGLVNFHLDGLLSDDTAVVWLAPALSANLVALLSNADPRALHQPRYSAIARPDSRDFQNSTAWLLETLEVARHGGNAGSGRSLAQRLMRADGFEPDLLHIPYTQRLVGALSMPNVSFTDHPLGTRLSGRYPVVTVDAIFRFLQRERLVLAASGWNG